MVENWNKVDTIIALSCIEHFGMNTYLEGPQHKFYDILAIRQIWNLLREDGTAYITVPFGSIFVEHYPHWRVYDKENLYNRIIQDFTVEEKVYFFSDDWHVQGVNLIGRVIGEETAMTFNGGTFTPSKSQPGLTDYVPPSLTVFLKLRKKPINRLAPGDR